MKHMRNVRNILFKAFLTNIVFVLVLWTYIMTDIAKYFMWALPGFTLDAANDFIMVLAGIVDIAGLVLFLVPCIAISWQIQRYKKTWEYELERILDEADIDDDDFMYSDAKPVKTKSGKTKKSKTKKSKPKKKR